MGAARWTRLVGAGCIGLGTVAVVAPLAFADPDDFSMTSTTMGFGSVFVGETGTERLIIRNTSGAALAPVVTGGLETTGPFEASTTCDGTELEPDDTCVFEYTYTPAAAGAHQSDFPLAVEGVNYTVSLTGTGVAPIEVSSPALAFGAVVVGETKSLDLTVTNVSNISRTPSVSEPAVESDVFSATSSCDGALVAGESCAVTYEFAPTAAGAATGADLVVVEGANHIVSLSGTGVPATTPTAVLTSDGPVAEGSTATVSFSGQDDPGSEIVEPFVYSFDWDGDGTFEVVGSTSAAAPVPAALTADGPATVTVTARITNQLGRFSEYETDVVVRNVEPALTVSGPDGVQAGTSAALAVAVVDPGSAAEEYTYAVDWDGDGTADQTLTGAAQRSIVHTFSAAGTFDVGVTVSDGDGGSDSATHRVSVTEDDPSATPSGTPSGTPSATPSPSGPPPGPGTETPSPTATPTPYEPSATPTPYEPPATPTPYDPSGDEGGDGGSLPETGAGFRGDASVLVGALLIGLGALLLLVTRRRLVQR